MSSESHSPMQSQPTNEIPPLNPRPPCYTQSYFQSNQTATMQGITVDPPSVEDIPINRCETVVLFPSNNLSIPRATALSFNHVSRNARAQARSDRAVTENDSHQGSDVELTEIEAHKGNQYVARGESLFHAITTREPLQKCLCGMKTQRKQSRNDLYLRDTLRKTGIQSPIPLKATERIKKTYKNKKSQSFGPRGEPEHCGGGGIQAGAPQLSQWLPINPNAYEHKEEFLEALVRRIRGMRCRLRMKQRNLPPVNSSRFHDEYPALLRSLSETKGFEKLSFRVNDDELSEGTEDAHGDAPSTRARVNRVVTIDMKTLTFTDGSVYLNAIGITRRETEDDFDMTGENEPSMTSTKGFTEPRSASKSPHKSEIRESLTYSGTSNGFDDQLQHIRNKFVDLQIFNSP